MSVLTRREFTRFAGLAAGSMAFPGIWSQAGKKGRKIRIGQIGTSHSHAAGKIETLKKLDHLFELAGIAEDNPEYRKAAEQKSDFQGLSWVSEKELLEFSGLEAVTIETDLDDLVPTAIRCIERGLHVHIDKPPGTSMDSLEKLLRMASDGNRVIQMGYMFRYNPAFLFCQKAVDQGWLGKLFEVDGVISKVVGAERRPGLAKMYRGAMMLLGCHLIDMVVAVCGKPEKVTGYRRQTLPDDLYDNELAVFEYDGITATVRSTLAEIEGQRRRQFVVCGSNGTLEIRPLEPPVVHLSLKRPAGKFDEGYQTVQLPKLGERYEAQLVDFAEMIRGTKENLYSMAHELNVHQALLEAAGLE
jgi:predicted dehydrogenase